MANRGLTITGPDFATSEGLQRSMDRLSPRERAAVLATLFPGVQLPYQSNAAVGAVGEQQDVDGDGKAETVLDQWLPLTGAGGVVLAAGDTADIEITPQRLFKPGILSVPAALAADVIITAFTIGIEPQFVSSGAVPLAAFAPDATYKLLSSHWAGPGVPVRMTVRDLRASGDPKKLYGIWFGDSVIRSQT